MITFSAHFRFTITSKSLFRKTRWINMDKNNTHDYCDWTTNQRPLIYSKLFSSWEVGFTGSIQAFAKIPIYWISCSIFQQAVRHNRLSRRRFKWFGNLIITTFRVDATMVCEMVRGSNQGCCLLQTPAIIFFMLHGRGGHIQNQRVR